MEKINIELGSTIDTQEFLKVIGFVSEEIKSYNIEDYNLCVEIEDGADIEKIKEEIECLAIKYISNMKTDNVIYENNYKKRMFYKTFSSLHFFDNKMVSLSEQSLFLFDFFDEIFSGLIFNIFDKESINIVEKQYPVLLPIDSYKKTGYLKRSPQYAILCCPACENFSKLKKISEVGGIQYFNMLKTPEYALSPSACFHVYEEYNNLLLEKNTIVTFRQSVFRNEGRFNYSEIGRLQDYHVREIVFIGDLEFVDDARMRLLTETKNIIDDLKLEAKICIASDPFIMPKMQRYKKIQVLEKTKYELRVAYESNQDMSVASFNLHGTAFSYPFNIAVKDKDTVTGCVGYGLERLVISFLRQYSENPDLWPRKIKEAYVACNPSKKSHMK